MVQKLFAILHVYTISLSHVFEAMAARVQAQVQSSVTSWAARPAPFSTRKHGTKAKFSGDSSVAERVKPEYPGGDYRSAVVYTEDPLPLGRVWQATVLSTTRGWDGGLVSGRVPPSIRIYPSELR